MVFNKRRQRKDYNIKKKTITHNTNIYEPNFKDCRAKQRGAKHIRKTAGNVEKRVNCTNIVLLLMKFKPIKLHKENITCFGFRKSYICLCYSRYLHFINHSSETNITCRVIVVLNYMVDIMDDSNKFHTELMEKFQKLALTTKMHTSITSNHLCFEI